MWFSRSPLEFPWRRGRSIELSRLLKGNSSRSTSLIAEPIQNKFIPDHPFATNFPFFSPSTTFNHPAHEAAVSISRTATASRFNAAIHLIHRTICYRPTAPPYYTRNFCFKTVGIVKRTPTLEPPTHPHLSSRDGGLDTAADANGVNISWFPTQTMGYFGESGAFNATARVRYSDRETGTYPASNTWFHRKRLQKACILKVISCCWLFGKQSFREIWNINKILEELIFIERILPSVRYCSKRLCLMICVKTPLLCHYESTIFFI